MNKELVMEGNPKKIHPQKFAMWMAIGSIVMMFAGLTSAYLVRQAQGNWRIYEMPIIFWVSTMVIVLSSITFILAKKAFQKRLIPRYRNLITITLLLGIAFCVLQAIGFYQLYSVSQAINIDGIVASEQEVVKLSGNPSESFLFIIAGLHLVHILGGIIALAIVYWRMRRRDKLVYDTTGLEIVGTYWHFVDALWLYLFVFFLVNQ